MSRGNGNGSRLHPPPKPRTTTVIKYERLQRLSELRINLASALASGLLPTHEGPERITRRPFRSSVMCASPVRARRHCFGTLPLGRRSVQGFAQGDPLQFAEGTTRASGTRRGSDQRVHQTADTLVTPSLIADSLLAMR